jgi:hypothetical protein
MPSGSDGRGRAGERPARMSQPSMAADPTDANIVSIAKLLRETITGDSSDPNSVRICGIARTLFHQQDQNAYRNPSRADCEVYEGKMAPRNPKLADLQ